MAKLTLFKLHILKHEEIEMYQIWCREYFFFKMQMILSLFKIEVF